MLDVHPPLAPTHTWKDFFLHIATITVVLLVRNAGQIALRIKTSQAQRSFNCDGWTVNP